jgi:hypothetical protein
MKIVLTKKLNAGSFGECLLVTDVESVVVFLHADYKT